MPHLVFDHVSLNLCDNIRDLLEVSIDSICVSNNFMAVIEHFLDILKRLSATLRDYRAFSQNSIDSFILALFRVFALSQNLLDVLILNNFFFLMILIHASIVNGIVVLHVWLSRHVRVPSGNFRDGLVEVSVDVVAFEVVAWSCHSGRISRVAIV